MGDHQAKQDRALRLVILGSAHSLPDEMHENSHLVLAGPPRTVLIDCPANPLIRLKQAGIDALQVSDLILTHFHPDHVSGVPIFLMNLWLLGRTAPLHVHGLEHALERTERMMELYDWDTWPGFFQVIFHRLPQEEMALVVESDDFNIRSSPVRHIIPTIGLRIDSLLTGRSIAYSSDTEPCPEMIRLAEGCGILIHEASGKTYGHSSAAQAGEVAHNSAAGRLVLIHYPVQGSQAKGLLEQASSSYSGPVSLAEDFMSFDF